MTAREKMLEDWHDNPEKVVGAARWLNDRGLIPAASLAEIEENPRLYVEVILYRTLERVV